MVSRRTAVARDNLESTVQASGIGVSILPQDILRLVAGPLPDGENIPPRKNLRAL